MFIEERSPKVTKQDMAQNSQVGVNKLNISHGTLQRLGINETVHSKNRGLIF